MIPHLYNITIDILSCEFATIPCRSVCELGEEREIVEDLLLKYQFKMGNVPTN